MQVNDELSLEIPFRSSLQDLLHEQISLRILTALMGTHFLQRETALTSVPSGLSSHSLAQSVWLHARALTYDPGGHDLIRVRSHAQDVDWFPSREHAGGS